MKILRIIFVNLIFVLLFQACQPNTTNTSQGGMCGDGVCDEAEQANPNLCPQDCLQQPPGESGSGEESSGGNGKSGSSNWSARVVWDCDADFGEGQIDRWSVEINYDFTVGADGKITGSGTGKSTRAECERPKCSCSITIDDFTVDVSGLQQGEYFSLQLNPRYNMQQCVEGGGNCPGCFPLNQLHACGCISGPLEVTMDARDGAIRSFECNPDMLSPAVAHGNTVLTQK